jgi:hypothetical protein
VGLIKNDIYSFKRAFAYNWVIHVKWAWPGVPEVIEFIHNQSGYSDSDSGIHDGFLYLLSLETVGMAHPERQHDEADSYRNEEVAD